MINGLLERSIDGRYPGARSSGVARTRLIDDWLVAEIDRGLDQLVILGAGFDSRCLRLSQLASMPVFELDQIAVLRSKECALRRSNVVLPDNLHAVAIDLLREEITPKLLESGFRRNPRTVVLWEGVTNYLQHDAVRGVFDTFAQLGALGSSIIFTYIHKGVLDSRFEAVGLERLRRRLARWGEPWTFGFYPEELPGVVSAWGYELHNDVGATDYRRLYLGKRADALTGYEFYRVAKADLVAVVNNDLKLQRRV